jgi:hypothetical protein
MNQRSQRNERIQISQIDQPRISLVPPVSRQRDYRGCHRFSLVYSTPIEQCEQPSGAAEKKNVAVYFSHPSIMFLPNPIQDAAHKADRRGEHEQNWTIPT